MKKILFLATYPTQSNGYARVGNILTNHLSEKYEVYYFGFSNYKSTTISRHIHPSIQLIDVIEEEKTRNFTDNFGVDIIEEFILSIKPDIVLVYNDIIVSCRHFNIFNELKSKHSFKVINYLDLVYDFENPIYINHVDNSCDKIIVFSQHWKNNLISMGVPYDKISILQHGFDNVLFQKIPMQTAREMIGLNINDFIFLNTNRNSYRKAQDITISAFLLFLKRVNFNEKCKLILHCDLENKSGYNIKNIITTECMKYGIDYKYILNNFIHSMGIYRLSDEKMNVLYNTCNVGLNTCIGEGFGLCNLELASIGKPQIMSKVGGLKDIFQMYPELCIEPVASFNIPDHTDGHNGIAYLCKASDFADRMYDIYMDYNKYLQIAYKCSQYIEVNYNWDTILEDFDI
jgi:glycosyltransferase involved in cell wall biosynthesis